MKKAYSKPQIAFDGFELSESIAAGCNHIANHTLNICGFYDEEAGWSIFYADVSGCEDVAGGDEASEGYASLCYHNPTDAWKLFSS